MDWSQGILLPMNESSARWNDSGEGNTEDYAGFELFAIQYRAVATLVYIIIFLLGVSGNCLVILTIYWSPSLHTSPYSYLASLACADLLAVVTAVPEGVVYTISSGSWYSGSFVCSAFVFLNFFSINVGTVSMILFTLERYIATCKPFLAQKLCTVERARRIIVCSWLVAAVYCSPWFILAEAYSTEDNSDSPHLTYCELTIAPAIYTAIFSADLVLFYILPLVGAVIAYWKIARVIRRIPDTSTKYGMSMFRHNSVRVNWSTPMHRLPRNASLMVRKNTGTSFLPRSHETTPARPLSRNVSLMVRGRAPSKILHRSMSEASHDNRAMQRASLLHQSNVGTSLRILLATVILFAVCWLPFRGLLVYNSLVKDPWLDLWYVLFAKCMIFLNCCLNPFLYTLLSKRFRKCVKRAVTLRRIKSLRLQPATSSWL